MDILRGVERRGAASGPRAPPSPPRRWRRPRARRRRVQARSP